MLLLGLLVGPFAHDLLLGAHLADQLVHACGEILHRVAGIVVRARRSSTFSLKIGERALHVEQGEAELRRHAGGDGAPSADCSSVMPDSQSSSSL